MDAAGFRLVVEAGLDLGGVVNAAGTPEQREWDEIVRRDELKDSPRLTAGMGELSTKMVR